MTARTTIAAAFVLFSCGGTPAARDAHPLPSAAATQPPRAKRAPSAEIATYFSVPSATMLVYADMAGLASTQLGGGLLANLGRLADAATAKCFSDAAHATREVVFATTREGSLGAIRYDTAKLDTKSCFEGALVPVAPGVALFGVPAMVERAKAGGGSLPATIALGDGEWARVWFDDKPARGTASLTVTDALFALHAEADLPEEMARDAAKQFERTRATLPMAMKEATSDERETIAKLLRFTTLRQDAGHLAFAIDLREPPVDQARDVGTMAALAIAGVRKYLLESKEAEARSVVPVIARSIVVDWERETLPPTPRSKRKLQSFPPIPQTVPRGTKYVSSEKEWAPWTPLRFDMYGQPQRYQYEIRAAKDGESAEVIARGDLNGDGKTSSFVITVKVKKDKDRALEISPMVETDPDE